MNISINCKLSLSKKLRAILGKDASLTLVSQDIVDGKGTAILSLASDDIKDVDPKEMGETSVMLVPVEMAEESPTAQSPVHATIFSTSQKEQKSPIVKKIAVVKPPEKGEESKAVKEEIEIPDAFSELKNKECVDWITNMEDLIAAANLSKGKQSSVDLNTAQNDRERAVMMEIKEKEEAIDRQAWIVNDKAGMLTINDLNISLPINSPFDLGNISARRIIASKDLRGLLKTGYVRFISPEEKDSFITQPSEDERGYDLPVFDNHEKAMDNIGKEDGKVLLINDKNAMDISEEDISNPTEEEGMILDLTKNAPVKKFPTVSNGIKKTIHGTSPTPSATPTPKNTTIKPIKKL